MRSSSSVTSKRQVFAKRKPFSRFLGEKLSDDEVAELFADCMDPEDEDGNVFYTREFQAAESSAVTLSFRNLISFT